MVTGEVSPRPPSRRVPIRLVPTPRPAPPRPALTHSQRERHPDFYSFTHRLKQHARTLGVDLLLVDAGDRVDGNGLVDAEPASPLPEGARSALDLFAHVPYDVVTTGNHELYKYEVAERVGRVLDERFGDRFVVSNVNITTGTGADRPYGNRVRKFETEQGRKVTAFGPLFDFKGERVWTRNSSARGRQR